MPRYRHALADLLDRPLLTDGGLETTLVFHDGRELPCFASFVLLDDRAGRQRLRDYYERYIALAHDAGCGFMLESPTWRANADWGAKLDYDARALDRVNRDAIALLAELRDAHERPGQPMPISGNLGPRGDGYRPDARMTAIRARDYHAAQVRSFADTDADLVSAFTMNYVEESVGIALAAREAGMPAVLSFTVETDGRLPDGTTLPDAIARTDAATGGWPAWYMINCAHPEHFRGVLAEGGDWRQRIRGLRANASTLSHAELDACTELDAGDPDRLAADHHELLAALPWLRVLGGCCGTDDRHVAAIARACLAPARAA